MAHPALAHRAAGALPIDRTSGSLVGVTKAQLHAMARHVYDGIENDAGLRPKFGSDLEGERSKLGAFLVETFLDEPAWTADFANGGLQHAHRIIHISKSDAAAWLGHARRAATATLEPQQAAAVIRLLRPIADALINERAPATAGARREARFQPTRDAVDACARGDIIRLKELLDQRPELIDTSDPGSADLLHTATSRGRVDVVQELIRRGVDVNKPAAFGVLMTTALCESRRRRRRAITDLLTDAGAADDVFTAAYLGDLEWLRTALSDDPSLAAAPDPASDFYRATILDHAVLGLSPDSVVPLIASYRPPAPLHGGALLVRAADAGQVDVVRHLLSLGADATKVTPGRWVLDDTCATLLLDAGANVNHAPTRWQSWIWRSCTGNHGNRDDPHYVAALVAAGADVHARAFGKTALHFAARAGFVEVTRVLLEAGADPNATDDEGLTPLQYASKRSDRVNDSVIRRLLIASGAS